MRKLIEVCVVFLFLGGISYFACRNIAIVNGSCISDVRSDDAIRAVIVGDSRVFDNKELDDKFVVYTYSSDIVKASIIDRLSGMSVGYSYDIDYDGLKRWVKEYNRSALKSEDAVISKSDDGFVLENEVYGEQIDYKTLKKDLKSGEVDIQLDRYYIKPEVLYSDLERVYSKLQSLCNWSVEYTNGEKITADKDYISYENGEIYAGTEWISQIISEKLVTYDTVGIKRSFITNSGDVIEVSGGTLGVLVDYDKEAEYLAEMFMSGESIKDREPEYSRNIPEIENTYIEVSIDKQHMWYYVDGVVVMETDVVTGTRDKHDTPEGVYFISEKVNGKYLVGDGYKTWVNKWMRLTNSGIGLHDAYWRGTFGGNRYVYSGSHGCINLPKNFAYDLYDNVSVYTPVIVY